MNKETIEKVVLKHCSKIVKSFYPEAILRDKEIIESNISEQEVINFLDNCEYLQKIGEIRCPNCCSELSYYDIEELKEDDDLECPDCDCEFVFDPYCTCYRYNVLHNKVPQNEKSVITANHQLGKEENINQSKFFAELNKWLEEQKEDNLSRAERCTCFDEVPREHALEWCAECYNDTLCKILGLRKKYHLN